jgi:hypothetical protein
MGDGRGQVNTMSLMGSPDGTLIERLQVWLMSQQVWLCARTSEVFTKPERPPDCPRRSMNRVRLAEGLELVE